jgi:hypothetical protein
LPKLTDTVNNEPTMNNPILSNSEDLSDFGTIQSDEESFVFGEIIDDQPIVDSIFTDSSTNPKLSFSVANGCAQRRKNRIDPPV